MNLEVVNSDPVPGRPYYEAGQMHVLWTKKDVAKYLQLSVSTIDRKIARGEIPYFKVGRAVRFRPEAIRQMLNRCSE